MKKLILESFTCFKGNDGDASDSPYFMVFAGQSSNSGNAVVNPLYLESLNDTVAPTGNPTPVGKEVVKSVDHNSIVIVALLERDDDLDLTGKQLDNVQQWMRSKFIQHSNSSNFPATAKLAQRMRLDFIRTIDDNTTNDDLIGIKRLTIPASGQPEDLDLRDDPDAGHYSVTFKLE